MVDCWKVGRAGENASPEGCRSIVVNPGNALADLLVEGSLQAKEKNTNLRKGKSSQAFRTK